MGSSLLGKNVVAEPGYIFLEGIHKLEGCLHLDMVHSPLVVHRIVDRRFARVHFLYIGNKPFRLTIYNSLLLPLTLVRIGYGQIRV